jgi:hypothetical protein
MLVVSVKKENNVSIFLNIKPGKIIGNIADDYFN